METGGLFGANLVFKNKQGEVVRDHASGMMHTLVVPAHSGEKNE